MNFGANFSGVTFFMVAAVLGANNGLSVDSVTGNAVLGNDQGDLAMPAQLLSTREIVTNGSAIRLVDSLPAFTRTEINDQRVNIEEQANLGFVDMHVAGGTSQINAQSSTPGGDSVLGLDNLTTSVLLQTNGVRPFAQLMNPTEAYRLELVLGVLRMLSASGTGNGLSLDSVANDVASTGTLSSANPGAGAGKWKLGTVVVAASALDATQYLEIEVNGVVRKVALIT
jgi:hypothetical protein